MVYHNTTREGTQNGQIVRPLVDTSNVDILNAIRNQASPDFMRRIPAATQGNVRQSLETMYNFPNLRNEFYDALVNRICGMYVHSMAWDNPLAEFKRTAQSYGKTYEEAAVGLINARVYDAHQEYLGDEIFGTYKPEVKSVFHTVNREEFFPVTINESQLKYAFTSEDGLGQLVSQVMEAPRTSDNLNEYLQMTHLFPEYARLGGYYRVHVDSCIDETLDEDELQTNARVLLRKIRTIVNTLPIKPSTKYNAAHMPSVVNRDDLIIFMPPEVHAAIDVNALAVLFNEEYARTNNRIIDIPFEDFGLRDVQCIVTTRDFFFVWDYFYGTSAPEYNPISMGTNYFLHHKEAISLSPFVPAVLFWTGEATQEMETVSGSVKTTQPTFQLRLHKYGQPADTPTNVERGGIVQVQAVVSVEGNPGFEPIGIQYMIEGQKSQFTHIDNTGVLVVGIDETVSELKVTAKATYIDPNAPEADSVISQSMTVPVVGDGLIGLNPGFVTNLTIKSEKDTFTVGDPQQFNATAVMTDGRTPRITNNVVWSSSDESVASVAPNGVVTFLTPGSVTISASVFAVTARKTITVTAAARSAANKKD